MIFTVYRHVSDLYSSALKTGMYQHSDMLKLCQHLLMVTSKFCTGQRASISMSQGQDMESNCGQETQYLYLTFCIHFECD